MFLRKNANETGILLLFRQVHLNVHICTIKTVAILIYFKQVQLHGNAETMCRLYELLLPT